MHRRLLSAAATGALLLGLAACGEPTEGPVTTPPPDLGIDAPSDGGGETEPSDGGGETEEPTAEVPDIPAPDPADYAGMDEHTEEGATEAYRYYIATVMWAHQSGDDSLSLALQTEDCESCSAFMETYRELQNHNTSWGEFGITDVTVRSHESDNYAYEIRYDFKTTPHERPKDDFSGRVNVGELEYSTVGGLRWENKKWMVGAISADWGSDALSTP